MRKLGSIFALWMGIMFLGCATPNCPDSGDGLGSTCGQGGSGTGSGSGSSSSSSSSSSGGNTTGTGQLYLSESFANQLDHFSPATTVSGSVATTGTIAGNITQLSLPAYLTVDTTNDRLYVPCSASNTVLVFDGISAASGNVAPTRVLSGSNTQLNGPVKVQYDSTNNLLYVANGGNSSVAVYSNATTTQGNVAPARTLAGSGTQITSISSIFLDTANDRLWVADSAANALRVFQASTFNGAPAPTRVVSGANTQLSSPADLVQTGTILFVSCTASIVRFAGSDTLSGNAAPAAVINGTATGLQSPAQLAYNGLTDDLYVADNAALLVKVFATASNVSGAVAPRRTINSLTGFSTPTGLALDLTR